MTNTQSWVLIAALAVVFSVGGYATGRYAAPTKTITTEKVITVEKQVVVTKVDTDRVLAALKDVKVQKDVHTVRVVEKQPDGTTKVTVTQDDKSKTDEQAQQQEHDHQVETKVEEKLVYQDREVTKLVERARPSWSLALQPGFAFVDAPTHNLLSTVVPINRLMLGVVVERRLLGPVFIGAWANSRLDGGLSLRLEW